MSKDFDPSIRHSGRLININQTIIPSSNTNIENERINDKYRVLQKMNKLSTILLKNRESIISKIVH